MQKYGIARKCTDCGLEVKAHLTKREAAFQLFETKKLFGPTCQNCGGSKSTESFDLPVIDEDLISEWAKNEALYFLSQDEDLIVGTSEYFELIIQVLAGPETLLHKKYALLSALCVIVFHNTIEGGRNRKPDINLKQRAIEELNNRKELLIQAGDWIMDYIKKVVYPQLEVDWHTVN